MKNSVEGGILKVEGELTIRNASRLRDIMSEYLRSATAPGLNIEGASDMDVTFIQLVCSMHRTATKLNKTITLSGGMPDALTRLAMESGLIRHIGCPDDSGGSCLWINAKGGLNE